MKKSGLSEKVKKACNGWFLDKKRKEKGIFRTTLSTSPKSTERDSLQTATRS